MWQTHILSLAYNMLPPLVLPGVFPEWTARTARTQHPGYVAQRINKKTKFLPKIMASNLPKFSLQKHKYTYIIVYSYVHMCICKSYEIK